MTEILWQISRVSVKTIKYFWGGNKSAARRRLEETDHPLDGIYADGTRLELASTVTASITKNNLTAFKKYLDDPDSDIRQYVGENGVIYSYDTRFEVYTYDEDDTFVNTNQLDISQLPTGTYVDCHC